jgi:hypothetical protein
MTTTDEVGTSQTFGVRTTVAFAAAREAFEREYTSTTPAGEVLAQALQAFEITTDGTSRYYLLHTGVEVAADQMIGALVDDHSDQQDHHAVTLKLRTETTSGTQ